MAKDFTLKDGEQVRTRGCLIASATVIEAGDMVTLTSNLIVKAGAASATIAYAPYGSADGETTIAVTVGNDFTLVGTGDAVFSADYKGDIVDLVGTTTLLIDVATKSTEVLQIGIASDSGVVGSTDDIEVRINKFLF